MLRFDQVTHSFYCGIDLHGRTMQVCVVLAGEFVSEGRDLVCAAARAGHAGNSRREPTEPFKMNSLPTASGDTIVEPKQFLQRESARAWRLMLPEEMLSPTFSEVGL